MGSFAPRHHAELDPQRPSAFAICDRCGFLYNRRRLAWQTEFRGRQIQRLQWLVCPKCWDQPNPTLRPIVLPADPVPILQPRSEPTFYGVVTVDMIKYTVDTDLITCDNGNIEPCDK